MLLKTDSISNTSITIAWDTPSDGGDGITGYNVWWMEVGTSIPFQKVITGNRVATLDKLTPYTQYIIQVQAYNGKGEGPWTIPLGERTSESGETGFLFFL